MGLMVAESAYRRELEIERESSICAARRAFARQSWFGGSIDVDVCYGGLRIEFLEMRLFGTRRSSDADG